MNHSRNASGIAIGLLLTVAAVWLWAHEGHSALPTRGVTIDADKGTLIVAPEARAALGVQTGEVTRHVFAETIEAPAVLVSPWQRQAYVTARAGGRISAIRVRPGQAVKAGETLAEVQSLDLEDHQRELVAAANELTLWEKNARDSEAAHSRGAIADRLVQEAQSRVRETRNALEIARRKLSVLGVDDPAIERLLRDGLAQAPRTLPVVAPIDGVIEHAEVHPGEVVEPSRWLFKVVDLRDVWVRVDLLESDGSRVSPGQMLELSFAGPNSEVVKTTIRAVGRSLDPKSRAAAAWTELENPADRRARFLPEMIGTARIHVTTPEPALAVPASAVLHSGGEAFVLLEEGPGQYLRREIQLGRQSGGLAEVLGGSLVPGERVVTAGGHELGSLFLPGGLQFDDDELKLLGIEIEKARPMPIDEIVELSGAFELPVVRRAEIASPVIGVVQRLVVDRDQRVNAGDVIAEISSIELKNLQLDLLRAHLDLGVREAYLQGLRSAAAAAAPRQVREAESAVVAARLRRDSLERKLLMIGLSPETLKDLRERGTIARVVPVRTPLAGFVVRAAVIRGQAVKPGEPLVEVHDDREMLVRANVPGREVDRIRVGEQARVRLTEGGAAIAATVARFEPEAQDAARTVAAWLRPTAPLPAGILHGRLARIAVVVGKGPVALAVPVAAVYRDGSQEFVFVQGEYGAFDRRPVTTGRRDDLVVEIVTGLSADDAVAVSGVDHLRTAYAAAQ